MDITVLFAKIINFAKYFELLDASTHLYMRVCPWSVVHPSRVFFSNCGIHLISQFKNS